MAGALGRSAFDLLLDALEMPEPVLSGNVMQDHHAEAGQALLSAGLLKVDGHDAVDSATDDHEDAPVALTWDADSERFGYFSESAGWVVVEHDRVARYRVDTSVLMTALMGEIAVGAQLRPVPLVQDQLWDLGEHRLPNRTHRVPVWFARRLHDGATWKQVKDAARTRPPIRQRLVLTSTGRGGCRRTLLSARSSSP